MKHSLLIAIIFFIGLNLAVWDFAASASAAASESNRRNENTVRARDTESDERASQSASGAKSVLQRLKEVWEKFTGNVEEDEENDADLPPIARGKISKDDYLQLRAAYIARLRGIDPDKPFDPHARSAAIKQMEEQESTIRKGGISALSAPGSEALIGGAWTFIGPAFLPNGQTTAISTAVSGRVTAIDVDPTNPNIAYVGAAQGGVFRTIDGGATWTPLMDSAQSLAIGAIAVAPSDSSKVYIGTGEGNSSIDSFFGVGIYRIDGANTASPTLVGPFNKNASNNDVFTGIAITKIIVDPTNSDVIFASTTFGFGGIGSFILPTRPSRGLFRSTNATQANPTFTKLSVTNANNGDRRVTDMVFEPGNPNNLVLAVGGFTGSDAAPDGGVYVSTNAQAATPTFTRVLTLGTSNSIIRANLAINKVGDTTTVLIATNELRDGSTTTFKNGALKASTNIFSSSPTFTNLPAADGFCGSQCFYDVFVTMDPNNASIIYLGGSANSGSAAASGRASVFQRSTDAGATFTRIDRGLHADSHAFVLTPTNLTRGYFGSDGGVWRSDNVNTATASSVAWTSLNNSTFSAIQFQSIALHPSEPKFTIGGTQDNGTEFRDPSGAWVRADGGDGGNCIIDQNAKDTANVTIYHTYFNQTGNLLGFARADSISGGFTNFFGCGGTPNGINCSDTATLFYAPLVRGPGIPNTVYYGTDRLYRSDDRGVTATVVSQAPLTPSIPLSAIGISPQNDNVRVVGLANGRVFATTTGSATLTDVSAGLPATYVSRAVIDPNNQNIAYLTFANFNIPGGTVWRTTNLSASNVTWTPVSGTNPNTLPNVPVNAFVVDPQNSNQLYAGTDIGVYFSQDSGRNWFPFGTGLPTPLRPMLTAIIRSQTSNRAFHTRSRRRAKFSDSARRIWRLRLTAIERTPLSSHRL
ncbi:MAG: exo-alpha-sialidase [Pyrinomonadaceae bacterium]